MIGRDLVYGDHLVKFMEIKSFSFAVRYRPDPLSIGTMLWETGG